MWKRLNNPKGAGARPPVQLDISNSEQSYSASSGLGIITPTQSPPGRDQPPPRPPREDSIPKGLPRLPIEPTLAPPPRIREATFRPVSSIYSQPSPNAITPRFPGNSYTYPPTSYPEEEVSPPSSPEFDGGYHRSQYQTNDDEVSPIDESPNTSRLGFGTSSTNRPSSANRPPSNSRSPPSNIPILRREKRRNQIAGAASNMVPRKQIGAPAKGGRIVIDPKWDPYSGEITTSDKGKSQSVKPGAFIPPGLRSVHRETGLALGNESSVSSGGTKNHSSFGERVRKLKLGGNTQQERPEWKGATGRTKLVAPVADNLEIPPMSIPPKSSRRAVSPQIPASTTPVSVVRYPYTETEPASSREPSFKAVLSNSGRNSPQVTLSPTTITDDPFVVKQSAATKTLARGYTTPIEVPAPKHNKKDSVGTIERNFLEALKDVSLSGKDIEPYVQPPSRFSVTTYAPSEAQSSPRPSGETFEPPMPTPPTYSAQQQSILDRKRPKIGGTQATPPRKAVNVNPNSPVFISMTSSIVSKRGSNLAKNLPMSPAEAESHDLVTSLQAQLDDLAHRRNNITKSIRAMTELMPKDHVILTEDVRRKREDEKLKVERLRAEEADVRREEHDLGLKLHRAWKRRDKDAVYEPTGLWVRRVTG